MGRTHGARRNITTDYENGWGVEEHLDVRDSLIDQWTMAAPESPAVVLTPSYTVPDAHDLLPGASPSKLQLRSCSGQK